MPTFVSYSLMYTLYAMVWIDRKCDYKKVVRRRTIGKTAMIGATKIWKDSYF